MYRQEVKDTLAQLLSQEVILLYSGMAHVGITEIIPIFIGTDRMEKGTESINL